MTTFIQTHAARFLQLAGGFVSAGSPLDAIHCAELAVKLDPSLWHRSGPVIRAAADCTLSDPQPRTDDLHRMRQHLQKLELVSASERTVHCSLPQPTADAGKMAETSSGTLPQSLCEDLRRLERMLGIRRGAAFDRARETIRSLLQQYETEREGPSPESDYSAHEDSSDWSFDSLLSTEHEFHNVGNDLYRLQYFEEAITFYDVALEFRSDLLETFFNRALAHTRLSRYELAEADLNRVIALNPNLAEAFYTRGLVHEYQLAYDAAIADYDQALLVDPSYRKAEDQRRIAKDKRDGMARGSRKSRDSDDYEGVVKDFSVYRVKPDCRLSQVGDHMAVKRELRKILTYLQGDQILAEWGGEMPRGVLLHGDPGTGKTHLARALAGEADCPFYAPPMSAILDMYVGNSEKNLRNLFKAAAEHEYSMIFLDELDRIASLRNESREAHEPWHSRLAGCLLDEMDNMVNRNHGVVVIGATNCLDAVDRAFLRPGRFTYIIEVKRPNEVGLAEIFLVCLETASLRAKRDDFLDGELERAVLSPRQAWLEQAFQRDDAGLTKVARIAARKKLVGDDVREVIRRVVDERIIAGIDGLDLGPISVADLLRHVQDYRGRG